MAAGLIWLKRQPSLAPRVCARPQGALPRCPSVSADAVGTPVPELGPRAAQVAVRGGRHCQIVGTGSDPAAILRVLLPATASPCVSFK